MITKEQIEKEAYEPFALWYGDKLFSGSPKSCFIAGAEWAIKEMEKRRCENCKHDPDDDGFPCSECCYGWGDKWEAKNNDK